ncbi:hypothetical protein SAMN05421821_102496 [Mucilaginibacter lappiensis]|uniref:Uncharacterized protein n=1 Tax=Mucilaginibacter lappiensis TaxID=354630 RepID=A0ABR6PET8_9SPHI|nr:hypothetical protein [Mucilaginibacter lappiensis]MBB6108267.1 hypothetical protein [Mucilaginibacter lappiensis]SIQ44813.1 hypothetical protein SAMN05421821_102496 [Mucilaginibacter lappiensis]
MEKVIVILLLCFRGALVMAQSDTVYHHLTVAREGTPLIVINDNIIGNLDGISPNEIDSIRVLKDHATMPARVKNLDKYGVIFVTLKKMENVKTKSVKEIKAWLGIINDAQFAVDGFLLEDENWLIATESIREINVIKNQDVSGHLTDVVINVWTLDPGGRKALMPGKRLNTDKPGVIYIR